MKLLFIYSIVLSTNQYKPISNPDQILSGISFISAYLKKYSHTTDLLVVSNITKKETIINTIKDFNPDLIGFTSVATQFNFIIKIAKFIKKIFPNIYLLAGGVHVTLNPNEAIKYFDAICIGEGEQPTLELLEQLKYRTYPTNIKNLWIKNINIIEKNPTRKFIQDLDYLPFQDRDIWEKWIKNIGTHHIIVIARGCPFLCTYCSNHRLSRISKGKYVRFRSVNNIIKEVNFLISKYPNTKSIYFEVETIDAKPNFIINLCKELKLINDKLNIKLTFGANLRVTPNKDYNEIFKSFKSANFKMINIGLESGSNKIREYILNRNYKNKDVINAAKTARKYKIKILIFSLIGLPTETLNDFKKTIKCNRIIQPDGLNLSIFYPYPGTDIYDLCKKKNLLDKKIIGSLERRTPVLKDIEFTKKQIIKEYEWFDFNVYKGYKSFLINLRRVLIRKLGSRIKLRNVISKIFKIKIIIFIYYKIYKLYKLKN